MICLEAKSESEIQKPQQQQQQVRPSQLDHIAYWCEPKSLGVCKCVEMKGYSRTEIYPAEE